MPEPRNVIRSNFFGRKKNRHVIDGWVDGWVGGWMGNKTIRGYNYHRPIKILFETFFFELEVNEVKGKRDKGSVPLRSA